MKLTKDLFLVYLASDCSLIEQNDNEKTKN